MGENHKHRNVADDGVDDDGTWGKRVVKITAFESTQILMYTLNVIYHYK